MRKVLTCSLIVFLAFFTACSSEHKTSEKLDNVSNSELKRDVEHYGDVLIEGSISDANNLIPILANDLTSHTIASLVYNGLVKYDKDLNLVAI